MLQRLHPADRPFARLVMVGALFVLALLLWPWPAFAEGAAAAPASGLLDGFLAPLLTPQGLASAAGLVGTVLVLLGVNSEVRRRRVALGIFHAFHIIEDIDAERGDSMLDKEVEGLKALDRWMVSNGWRPLKPGEQEVAKLGFQAMNGATKVAEKVTAAAAELPEARPTAPIAPVPPGP